MNAPTQQPNQSLNPGQESQNSTEGKHVCPFCGTVSLAPEGICPHCNMDGAAASRPATKALIGPWYVLQPRLPAIPGITFARLLGLVKKGRIRPNSVVRGPTTHQFWRFAGQVKGLSREFGICYDCGEELPTDAAACPACSCSQLPPANPDALLESYESAPSNRPTADHAPDRPDWSHDENIDDIDASHFADSYQAARPSLRQDSVHRPSNVLGTRGAIATAFNLKVSPKRRSKGRKRLLIGGLLGLLVLGGATCVTFAAMSPDSAIGQWFADFRNSLGDGQSSR
jgi:hypothetical protein